MALVAMWRMNWRLKNSNHSNLSEGERWLGLNWYNRNEHCCRGVYRLSKVVEKDYTHMRTHDHIYTVPVKSTSCPPKTGIEQKWKYRDG